MNITCYQKAENLPELWDSKTISYFQRRQFLEYCDRFNPCRQRYYVAGQGENFAAGAIVYQLKLDLLTFSGWGIPIHMNIVGIPCSVSYSGFIGTGDDCLKLFQAIIEQEEGMTLALNLPFQYPVSKKFTTGNTLPTIIINRSFQSWTDYLNSLRADYRRRIKSIVKNSSLVVFDQTTCDRFSEEMYHLYLQVYNKSRAKLEILNFDFFYHLPPDFNLISARISNRLVGWAITLQDAHTYYFFLGGLNYDSNGIFDIYFRLLMEVVRSGIEAGAGKIDLGQTSEIPKLRLGGQSIPLFLAVTHSKPLYRSLLRSTISYLEYKRTVPEHHVFKEIS